MFPLAFARRCYSTPAGGGVFLQPAASGGDTYLGWMISGLKVTLSLSVTSWIIAFVVGSIILMDTDVEGYSVAWPLIAAVAALSAAFFIGVVIMALKARNRNVVSGQEEMIGAPGEALENFKGHGRVRVHSEEWQARSSAVLKRGQKVKVVGIEGLILTVEPYNAEGH